jgi:tetratricopeptide (TPR) repeat protein
VKLPSLRVERALHLLPDIDALGPLRSFLVSVSRGNRGVAEPYGTVGKRVVEPTELRDFIPRAVGRLAEHLSALYESAVEALEAEERGDLVGSIKALLAAGEREERAGRAASARAWYAHALRIAEELRDRHPEIQTLRHLGRLDAARGAFELAGRSYQRGFALAEAEQDLESAALACHGLGQVAAAQLQWTGAMSWYARGLQFAAEDTPLAADLRLALAEVSRQQGETRAAGDWLEQAQRLFQVIGEPEGMARALNARGQLDSASGNRGRAFAHYHEALAGLPPGLHPEVEMEIRRNLAELHIEQGRFPDAEDEIRRAEELAITHNLPRQLARLYTLMGCVRGAQSDEAGFVFFEKAIELCRGREPEPDLEAAAYLEYARFRRGLGELDECRAYLCRAQELLGGSGDSEVQSRIRHELAEVGAG